MQKQTWNYITNTFFVICLLFIAWPWLLGVFDIAAWAITGQQWSAIPWNDGRGIVLILWPIVMFFVVGFAASIFT